MGEPGGPSGRSTSHIAAARSSATSALAWSASAPVYARWKIPNLIQALGFLGKLVDETDDDLGSWFGGRTAFDQGRTAGQDAAFARPN
jgi:hypothetical protein